MDNTDYIKYINDIKSLNNSVLNISLEDIKSTENTNNNDVLEKINKLLEDSDTEEDSVFIIGVAVTGVEVPKPQSPKLELLKLKTPELPKPQLPKPQSPKPEPPKPEPPKLIQKGSFSSNKLRVPIGQIIEPPKLVISRFRGGSTSIDINKVIKLLNIKPKLAELVKYIYLTYGKLLSMDDIIEVLVVLKYSEFTDTPMQDISTIPPEFRYNFTDLVKRDINNPELIKNYNTQLIFNVDKE